MKKLRVLYFEDDHHDAKLAQHAMRRAGLDIDWLVVSEVDDYCSALVRGGLDLILSDNGILGFSGKAALEAARTQCPQVPFIVVSGSDDPKVKAATLNAGAADFISKDYLTELALAIRRIKSVAARDC